MSHDQPEPLYRIAAALEHIAESLRRLANCVEEKPDKQPAFRVRRVRLVARMRRVRNRATDT